MARSTPGPPAVASPGVRVRAAGLLLAIISLPWSVSGVSIGFGLAFVGHVMTGWRPRPMVPRVVAATGLALAATFLLSTLWSENTANALRETKGLWPLLGMIPCAAAVRVAARPRVFLWAWLASASTAALWLLVWKFLDPELVSHRIPVNRWRLNIALTHALAAGALLVLERRGRLIACADVLAVGAALALFGERAPVLMTTCFLGLAALVYALGRGRAAWLRGLSLAGVVVAVALSLTNPATRAMLERGPDTTWQQEELRVALWTAAWRIWEAAPLTGTGMGDVSKEVEAYVQGPLGYPDRTAAHAHSNLLQILAGAGLPGGLAYLALTAALLVPWMSRSRLRSPAGFLALWAWGFLVFGGFLECTVLQSYFLTPFALLYAIGLGLAEATPVSPGPGRTAPARRGRSARR